MWEIGSSIPSLARLRADDGQLGSNANVAGRGIRKGTSLDETRPIIPPWPLPPLRPNRAAYGGQIIHDFQRAEKRRIRPDDLLARFEEVRRAEQLDETAAQMLAEKYI